MPEKTEAQKKAQKKYMEKFMVAQVRMEREKYERVQAHAASCGESTSAFINRAIDHQISQDRDKGPSEALQGPPGGWGISLHLEALQTAQNAAQKAGETVSQFVERAVEETADGDALPKEVIFGRAVDVIAEHYGVSCWDVLKELEGLVDEQGEKGG